VLVALQGPPGGLNAHELERTAVRLALQPDGSFVLEVANDADWLLLRLEAFTGVTGSGLFPAEIRDERLGALGAVFIDRIVLFVDGAEVRPESADYIEPATASPSGAPPLASYRLHGRMPPGARMLRWYYGLVVDPYPLTVVRPDGSSLTEWIGGDAWSTAIDLRVPFRPPSPWSTARQYLELGFTHILPKGADHILFVLGLFLLSARVKPVLIQVTTFTIAHSVTLALSMYGIVSLPGSIVEPLIALSIVYVALENLRTRRLTIWRVMLVFLFGLLHGLGFAGVLKDLQLPRSEFLLGLVCFNLGVEAGQLAVIALAAGLVGWWRGRDWYRARIVVPASVTIAAIGLYWTLTRTFS
jgi:hydrogenase/urease accessory protein HupE